MSMLRTNSELTKINTRYELLELLKEYKGILKTSIIDYLNSLIELEFSAIKDYISDSDRKVLFELEIYRLISIYNIYSRTKKIFDEQNELFKVFGNNEGIEGLTISTNINDKQINLLKYRYGNGLYKDLGSQNKSLGIISLYQAIESREIREAELERVMKTLEVMYDEKNPYPCNPEVCGGPGVNWEFNHIRTIRKFEEKFKLLDSRKELSEEDKMEIELSKKVHDLLFEEFGLVDGEFSDEEDKYLLRDIKSDGLEKTLIKKTNNLTITNNIKYI